MRWKELEENLSDLRGERSIIRCYKEGNYEFIESLSSLYKRIPNPAVSRLEKLFLPLHPSIKTLYIVGRKGTGKSTLVATMILEKVIEDDYGIVYASYEPQEKDVKVLLEESGKRKVVILDNCHYAVYDWMKEFDKPSSFERFIRVMRGLDEFAKSADKVIYISERETERFVSEVANFLIEVERDDLIYNSMKAFPASRTVEVRPELTERVISQAEGGEIYKVGSKIGKAISEQIGIENSTRFNRIIVRNLEEQLKESELRKIVRKAANNPFLLTALITTQPYSEIKRRWNKRNMLNEIYQARETIKNEMMFKLNEYQQRIRKTAAETVASPQFGKELITGLSRDLNSLYSNLKTTIEGIKITYDEMNKLISSIDETTWNNTCIKIEIVKELAKMIIGQNEHLFKKTDERLPSLDEIREKWNEKRLAIVLELSKI